MYPSYQKSGGSWIEKTLHDFQGTGTDGGNPVGGLIFDGAGNLYGTTSTGGSTGICNQYGCGTVFKLSPKSGGGGWSEKILYSFQGYPTDGSGSTASLIFDTAGNLFGTTESGGIHICAGGSSCGTVFELSPQSGKAWHEIVLYDFGGPFYRDGDHPFAGVTLDPAGNLYGTTMNGGTCSQDGGCGTVFEITP
jgi:uncharacterized repeat protein (TIGR03803 family)